MPVRELSVKKNPKSVMVISYGFLKIHFIDFVQIFLKYTGSWPKDMWNISLKKYYGTGRIGKTQFNLKGVYGSFHFFSENYLNNTLRND